MADQLEAAAAQIKPTIATLVTGAATAGNVAVWQEAVRGWAALAVGLLAVPTAFGLCLYWLVKGFTAWRDRNK